MKSIRLYLVAALLATITLGNFLAALHGYRSSMREAQHLLDTQLADTASLIQTLRPAELAVTDRPSSRLAFQIWSADGALVQRSANTPETPITRFEGGFRDENFAGYRWRVLSQLDEETARWTLVAERIDIRIALADNIILRSVLPIVYSVPVIAAIVWLVVGNGLSLVRRLADELRSKRVDDLSRLRTAQPPAELAPVVDAVNDLLQRLEASVQRERRFSADAAHELRTPLSAIKVHVHNLRSEFPEHTEALARLDGDLARLGHLIEQILLLHRMTPEHYQARMRTVDLHRLAQTVIGECYADIEERAQTIALSGASQSITGDEPALKILLSNLILNASKYSPRNASITVRVDCRAHSASLAVSDTGPGIPQAELARVMDRFYRVGGDRHGSEVAGCGLGLSIAKHIADLHHATLELRNNENASGLTAEVVFPPWAGVAPA